MLNINMKSVAYCWSNIRVKNKLAIYSIINYSLVFRRNISFDYNLGKKEYYYERKAIKIQHISLRLLYLYISR